MFFSNSTAFAIETEHATTAQRRNYCVGAEGAPGDGGLIESGRDGPNVREYLIRELHHHERPFAELQTTTSISPMCVHDTCFSSLVYSDAS